MIKNVITFSIIVKFFFVYNVYEKTHKKLPGFDKQSKNGNKM